MKKIHKGNNTVYVDRIVYDTELSEEFIREYDNSESWRDLGVYLACEVYGKDNELLYIAFVTNNHQAYRHLIVSRTTMNDIYYF